jgi:hypothetical protein
VTANQEKKKTSPVCWRRSEFRLVFKKLGPKSLFPARVAMPLTRGKTTGVIPPANRRKVAPHSLAQTQQLPPVSRHVDGVPASDDKDCSKSGRTIIRVIMKKRQFAPAGFPADLNRVVRSSWTATRQGRGL